MDGDGYLVRRGGVFADGVFLAAGLQLLRVTASAVVVQTSVGVLYTFDRDAGWSLIRQERNSDVWFGLVDGSGARAPVAFAVPDADGFQNAARAAGWEAEESSLPWWWWMRPAAALLGA